MANLTETASFDAGVYQLETSDPVLGGPGGIANTQAQALANRTKYLKLHVDALEDGSTVPPGVATEAYVQAELNKRDFKQSARLATTANITLSGSQSIDGVTTSTGDRVLVKNQTTGSQNGIYVASGTSWTRATDADENVDVTSGIVVFVAEGTTQAETIWKLTTDDPIVVGTTALVFTDVTAGYAALNSPTFTGTPTAPTASAGNNGTQVATTEFATKLKNGRASVSVAGGSDVTVTSAQYGLGILDLSGVITANLNLILPSTSGTWVIANNSTGSFNITAKTAAGTGVVVPQGYAIVVYGDGTNIYAASASGQAFLNQQVITSQVGTTITIPGGYTVGAIVLQKNGFWLVPGVDFTATNGSTITLTVAAIVTDEFLSVAFSAFSVANALPLSGGTMTGALTMSGAAINEAQGANIASAATINLDSATGNYEHVTGTTGIGTITLSQGRERTVVFDGILTLTHSANLLLPGAANLTTDAGTVMVFRGEAAGVVRCVGGMRANGSALSPGGITIGTAIATTSGTAADFTGIPSEAKRVTVMLRGVSTNGTSLPQLQIGSGSVDTTGYSGTAAGATNAGAVGTEASVRTTGIPIIPVMVASDTWDAQVVLTNMGADTWIFAGVVSRTATAPYSGTCGGDKTLSGALDRIRLTTVNGTDTFDAGSMNISWET